MFDDEGDLQLQQALARAREEYRWTKQYAIDTLPDQEGLSDEEKEAAQRAAAGEPADDGIEDKEPDPDAAAELQRKIKAQREAEQKLRKEAVEKAEAEAEAKRKLAAELEA